MTLFDVELPLVAAPMAGGGTTSELVRAVMGAGAFAFVPAGYLSADEFDIRLKEAQVEGHQPGVNLFVPRRARLAPAAFDSYRQVITPEAEALGVELDTEPHWDADDWHAKLGLLLSNPVPWVSFTFGLPTDAEIASLHDVGTRLVATVTTVPEAKLAARTGMDALIVQGPEAGGHSATFDPLREIEDVDLVDLIGKVRAAVDLPIAAAGGVDGPDRVAELIEAGAETVTVGTLLLRSDESGASATHREALTDPRFQHTVLTRAFTGRPARALFNGFIDRHDWQAPTGYPEIHHLTRRIRAAAAEKGDADRLHLWAGTGFRAAQAKPAAEIIQELSAGVR
ncbi:nitronate monooxygenase [Nocardioides sp. Kera G14]|uniref:nitronate monooxygenase n=1 Tax=Nocardioides sp. Kera G14 TaxID=2884264 RepID=UPI001D0FA58A|nr:nitronate monooxygenase [Nocardioides sp. Kera G14]UDY22282.1 nitronate monooxygenase [Nocardioides sp. Kera G14]